MNLSEIIKTNRDLKKKMGASATARIVVLRNVTVTPLKEILECKARLEGINLDVEMGGYHTIVQDSMALVDDKDIKIIFWELANLVPEIHHNIELMNDNDFEVLYNLTKKEIAFVLTNLQKAKLVIFNLFSSAPFTEGFDRHSKLHSIQKQLNDWLLTLHFQNIYFVDINTIYMEVSRAKAIDYRLFRMAKHLYTNEFFDSYADQAFLPLQSIFGKIKKVLVLDCDNTLWGGTIGDMGFNEIQLSEESKKGPYYREVQSIIKRLAKSGVIIALNSKNDEKDVDHLFNNHPSMVLNHEDVLIKTINWNDKVSNLRTIANELGVGLDSLVFIDDSPFEIDFINKYLPSVKTYQVPPNLEDYPTMMRRVCRLFFNHSPTQEDVERLKYYRADQLRQNEFTNFTKLDDYLQSLGMELSISINELSASGRIAQLTQKTNQFNLTTKRYSESEIVSFMSSPNRLVFNLHISDRFGSYGIVGVCILVLSNDEASIDTLLLSCRVIGRKIEVAFMNFVMDVLNRLSIKSVYAEYIRSDKNSLTECFYNEMGFQVMETTSGDSKRYSLQVLNYDARPAKHINISNPSACDHAMHLPISNPLFNHNQ